MSNRTYDRLIEHQNYVEETACCECGYHRNGSHHPGIRCPKTGRCGNCGNEWPCPECATTVWFGIAVTDRQYEALEIVRQAPCHHAGFNFFADKFWPNRRTAKMRGVAASGYLRGLRDRTGLVEKTWTTTQRGNLIPNGFQLTKKALKLISAQQ